MGTAMARCRKCQREHAARILRNGDGLCFTCTGKLPMSLDEMRRITVRGLADTELRLAIINKLMVIGAIIGPTGLCKG